MSKTVYPGFLSGEIDIIPSKSYIHRYLIAAALADSPTQIVAKSDAIDVLATTACLKGMGADIEYTDGVFEVFPITGQIEEIAVLPCEESGSTLRFLLPLTLALGQAAQFKTAGRLAERPLGALVDCLSAHGGQIHSKNPLQVYGKLTAGDYNIAGNISSQYITGLLFALPILDGDSKIIIEGGITSGDYINITLQVLAEFGIKIQRTEYGFYVLGGQKYISPKQVVVEGCWSNAAFFLVAGAIAGDLVIKGLNMKSAQGDKAILDILQNANVQIKVENGKIHIKKSKFYSFLVDGENIPDIIPILAVAGIGGYDTSIFQNLTRLRDKESDRLLATTDMLNRVGIATRTNGINLTVECGTPCGGEVLGYNDHRIVMAASVLALASKNPITISDTHAVAKSYPQFFDEFVRLGGKIQ